MQTSKIKNGIIVILLACIGFLATCEFAKPPVNEVIPLQDTIFLSQWRREKQEKIERIAEYEKELTRLQRDNDSMQILVSESKQSISAYRFKAKHFQKQLKQAISNVLPMDSLQSDTISPILDSLIVSQEQSDTACDQTINVLETIVANRDSSILFQKGIENSLRDLNKEQELQNQVLTQKLNLAFKNQRKINRQNKILAGGIFILSGITTSLFLIQSLK